MVWLARKNGTSAHSLFTLSLNAVAWKCLLGSLISAVDICGTFVIGHLEGVEWECCYSEKSE